MGPDSFVMVIYRERGINILVGFDSFAMISWQGIYCHFFSFLLVLFRRWVRGAIAFKLLILKPIWLRLEALFILGFPFYASGSVWGFWFS